MSAVSNSPVSVNLQVNSIGDVSLNISHRFNDSIQSTIERIARIIKIAPSDPFFRLLNLNDLRGIDKNFCDTSNGLDLCYRSRERLIRSIEIFKGFAARSERLLKVCHGNPKKVEDVEAHLCSIRAALEMRQKDLVALDLSRSTFLDLFEVQSSLFRDALRDYRTMINYQTQLRNRNALHQRDWECVIL